MKANLIKIMRAFHLQNIYLALKARYKRIKFYIKYGKVDTYQLEIKGIKLVYSTKDVYSKRLFYPKYDSGKYPEPPVTDLFIDKLKSNDCVLDIGANLGFFTCLAGKIAGNGQVHAFEVDKKCFPILEKNIALNNLDNVKLCNYAVSDHNRSEKIPVLSEPSAYLNISGKMDQSNHTEVKAITIDEYLKQENLDPDFIKIDVEGAELKVLCGMGKTLDSDKLKMLIEVHVNNLSRFFNSSYKDILKILHAKGFKMLNMKSHRSVGGQWQPIDSNSELVGNTMIYCEK